MKNTVNTGKRDVRWDLPQEAPSLREMQMYLSPWIGYHHLNHSFDLGLEQLRILHKVVL